MQEIMYINLQQEQNLWVYCNVYPAQHLLFTLWTDVLIYDMHAQYTVNVISMEQILIESF